MKNRPSAKNELQNFDTARSLEWLETNGLGGWAGSTVSGAHSRRYHGLLVAALHPPVGRTVLVSKLEESIIIKIKKSNETERFDLSANQYPGAVHPEGFQHLTKFERDLFPVFTYQAGEVTIRKTVAPVQGENTTLVLYEVLKAPLKGFTFELLPLYSSRDFHSLSHANDAINRQYVFQDEIFRIKNYRDMPEVLIAVPGASFTEDQKWYYNFEYAVEQYRGLDFQEDLFSHGKFSVALKKGSKFGVILSTQEVMGRDAFELFDKEKSRRATFLKPFENNQLRRLVLAADQFVVNRDEDLKTVIAGYHWFSDWGRDTMISLPGLCLSVGRYGDARKILQAFANSASEGMLPNHFPDQGETPDYNTIDATLWFFCAVYQYYKVTRDGDFILSILPVLENIIEWHYKGTRYNIHVDEDELLYGGQEGVQLTWMDAKVGDWVVTPRRGKSVEINALWYNALSILGYLLVESGREKDSESYRMNARKTLESFNSVFWNEQRECLYDYVDGDYRNDDIRPNQIYAISLPFPLLTMGRAEKVLNIVEKHLLTPRGLRSLSPSHKDYRPFYGGGVWSRDGSYHQGTVWSFLLGPFVDALVHVRGEKGRKQAKKMLDAFLAHLDEACVGSVSEIFDADLPHAPRGCVAQAWGVAETLRVAVEYRLLGKQKKVKSQAAMQR